MNRTFSELRGIAAGFMLLVMLGCAGIKAPDPLRPVAAGKLIPLVANHNARVATFSGRALMTVQAEGERPFRATLNIVIKRPDSLWFKLEGPLGLDLATGHFGGGLGAIFVPFENQLYKGTVERLQALNVLPIDLPVTELMMGFVGLPVPTVPASDSLLSIGIEDRQYHLNYSYGEDILVDPRGPVVTRWEKRDPYNDMMWLWQGESFYKIKGIRLPKVIKMAQSQPRQQVSLVYDAIRPNPSLKTSWYDIKLPEGVKIIEL